MEKGYFCKRRGFKSKIGNYIEWLKFLRVVKKFLKCERNISSLVIEIKVFIGGVC